MSDGSKSRLIVLICQKPEIKDDKGIDKRNLTEIRYSFDLKFS